MHTPCLDKLPCQEGWVWLTSACSVEIRLFSSVIPMLSSWRKGNRSCKGHPDLSFWGIKKKKSLDLVYFYILSRILAHRHTVNTHDELGEGCPPKGPWPSAVVDKSSLHTRQHIMSCLRYIKKNHRHKLSKCFHRFLFEEYSCLKGLSGIRLSHKGVRPHNQLSLGWELFPILLPSVSEQYPLIGSVSLSVLYSSA